MMNKTIAGKLDATGLRFALVVSRFNDFVTSRLLAGARDALLRHGASESGLIEVWVPGCWEMPLVAGKLAQSGQYDALICLGCVIRGQTTHHAYISHEAAKGLAQVALESGIPIGFGLLTTDTLEQAIERAGTKSGNKGADAAVSAIEAANVLRELGSMAKPTQ